MCDNPPEHLRKPEIHNRRLFSKRIKGSHTAVLQLNTVSWQTFHAYKHTLYACYTILKIIKLCKQSIEYFAEYDKYYYFPLKAVRLICLIILHFCVIVSYMSIPDTKFKINQKVVYPSQGVGKITDIFEKKFNEKNILYYKIYLDVSDMIVMIPVDRADEMGIRSIVSADEAQKAVDLLGENFEPVTSDWKLRYQMNLELLKKGSISDIATIVRCLYHRSKVKELPILERKLYDNAKKLLEDEISFSMGKSPKEVETLLHAKLEPPGTVREVKRILEEEEDEFSDDEEEDEEITSGNDRSSDDDDNDDSDDKDDADDESDDKSSSSTDEEEEEDTDEGDSFGEED
jgi:CarD family transcriptional regulator